MKDELYWEIPSSLNLKTALEKRPPAFKYHIDKFYYILDYLSRGMDLEDLDNNEGFINVNARKLQGAVHDYKKYLDYLLQRKIIRTDMNYVVGKKSKGYLIQGYREHRASVEKVPITSWSMIKRRRRELAEIEQNNKSTGKSYPHLTKWFNNKLQIDVIGAKQRVELLFPEPTGAIRGKLKGKPSDWNKRYKAIYSIDKFARQDFYYSVDNNVGRFHSNLTNIKRELRNYITYDNQKLVNVDIKNCQPLFSQILLSKSFYKEGSELSIYDFPSSPLLFSNNTPPPHSYMSYIIMIVKTLELIDIQLLDKYLSIANSGEFYKQISEIIFPNEAFDKKKIKDMMFIVFFSRNQFIGQRRAEAKRRFALAFPEVYKIFKLIKRKNHSALAHILQRIESEIIIRRVAPRISEEKPNLPFFTIHDSVVTTIGNEKYVTKVLKEEIKRFTGFDAKLGLEFWK